MIKTMKVYVTARFKDATENKANIEALPTQYLETQ